MENSDTTQKQITEKILKEIKPKVLNVDELKRQKIILTDSYSWRDMRKAISLALEAGKSQARKEFVEMIEELEIYRFDMKGDGYILLKELLQKLNSEQGAGE